LEAEVKVMRIALEERGHSQCSELKTMIADLEHRIGTIEKEKSTLHTELRMVREEKIRLHGVCEDMTMQLRVAIEDASNSKEKAEEIMEANDELSRVLTAKSERNDVLESEVEALQKICEDLEKAEQGALAEAHKDIKESKETFECGNKHLFAENTKLQKELHAMELIVDTLNRQTRAKDKDLEILNMEKLELTESLNDSPKMWSIRKQEYMKKVDILEQEKEYLLERLQTVEIENEKLAISLRDMENMKFRNVEPLRSTASADRANATEEADAPAVKRLKGQLADSEIALMNTQTQLVQAEDKIESQFSQISELNAQSELASRQQSLLQDEFDHVKCALENSRSEFVQIEEENQVLIKELAKWSQSMQSSMKISAGIEGKSTHNGVGSTLPGGPSSDQSASQRVSDEEMALPKNQLVNISVAPLISPLRHTSSFTSDDSTPRSERSGRSSRTSRSYRKLASGEQTPDGSMKRKSSRRLAKKSSDSSFGVFSSLILGVDSVSNKVYSPTSPCTPRTPGDEKS
jgi:chromosome segregation ATPase